MSRLYFTTEGDEVELKGWEYHWIRGLADEISEGFLSLQYNADDWRDLINPRHYMYKHLPDGHNRLQWAQSFLVALRADGSGGEPLLLWKGKAISGWQLMLNTAIIVGGDAVKLGTRLGGQGEIHAWIAGPDRSWVADMIEQAVRSGVYREGLPRTDGDRTLPTERAGWTEVAEFLRASDHDPVVTHYSVDESFPGPHVAGVPWDAWEDIRDDQRWELSMRGLTEGEWSQRFKGLQIKPDDWNTFRYGHTLSILDLRAPDREARLDRVLAKGWLK